MSDKEEKKEFVEPQFIKCEEPLDKVTLNLNHYECRKYEYRKYD